MENDTLYVLNSLTEINTSLYNDEINDTDISKIFTGYVPMWTQVLYLCYLALIFITGIPGNLIIIIIYVRIKPKKSCDWFILFIGITDFIVCVLSPIIFLQWEVDIVIPFATGLFCGIGHLWQLAAMSASSFMLTVMSLDRYIRVCQPNWKPLTPKMSKYIGMICIVAAISVSMYPSYEEFAMSRCEKLGELEMISLAHIYTYFAIFVVCFVTVGFCYGRVIHTIEQKIKAKQRLFDHSGLHDGNDNEEVHSQHKHQTHQNSHQNGGASKTSDKVDNKTNEGIYLLPKRNNGLEIKSGHSKDETICSVSNIGLRKKTGRFNEEGIRLLANEDKELELKNGRHMNDNDLKNKTTQLDNCESFINNEGNEDKQLLFISNNDNDSDSVFEEKIVDHSHNGPVVYSKDSQSNTIVSISSDKQKLVSPTVISNNLTKRHSRVSISPKDIVPTHKDNYTILSNNEKCDTNSSLELNTKNNSSNGPMNIRMNPLFSQTNECQSFLESLDTANTTQGEKCTGKPDENVSIPQQNTETLNETAANQTAPSSILQNAINNGVETAAPVPTETETETETETKTEIKTKNESGLPTKTEPTNNIATSTSALIRCTMASSDSNNSHSGTGNNCNKAKGDRVRTCQCLKAKRGDLKVGAIGSSFSTFDDDELYSDAERSAPFFIRAKKAMCEIHDIIAHKKCSDKSRRKRWIQERRVTMMLMCITAVFIGTWIPPWILYLLSGHSVRLFENMVVMRVMYRHLDKIYLLNYFSNFPIYYLFNKTFRMKVKALIPRFIRAYCLCWCYEDDQDESHV